MELGKEENRRRDSGRGNAQSNPLLFIHTVSSNYQCIYSIPRGVAIVFKNNRAHTQLIILHAYMYGVIRKFFRGLPGQLAYVK